MTGRQRRGVHEDHLALWDQHFGAQYQSFDHDDCHFIIINAQIINSGFCWRGGTSAIGWRRTWRPTKANASSCTATTHPTSLSPTRKRTTITSVSLVAAWILELLEAYGVEAPVHRPCAQFLVLPPCRQRTAICCPLQRLCARTIARCTASRPAPTPNSDATTNQSLAISSCMCTKAGACLRHRANLRKQWSMPAARKRRCLNISPRFIHASTGAAISVSTCARTGWRSSRYHPPAASTSSTARRYVTTIR